MKNLIYENMVKTIKALFWKEEDKESLGSQFPKFRVCIFYFNLNLRITVFFTISYFVVDILYYNFTTSMLLLIIKLRLFLQFHYTVIIIYVVPICVNFLFL